MKEGQLAVTAATAAVSSEFSDRPSLPAAAQAASEAHHDWKGADGRLALREPDVMLLGGYATVERRCMCNEGGVEGLRRCMVAVTRGERRCMCMGVG